MRVREATTTDAEAIAEVHVHSWQSAYRGYLPDHFLDGLSVDRRRRGWMQTLHDTSWPATGTFVFEDDDRRLLGFAHLSPSRDADAPPLTGEVNSIYLHPEAWRRGGGRLLIGRAVDRFRQAGFTSATLWVFDHNLRAQRFYDAMGWQADGAHKVDTHETLGLTLTEIRYRRDL